MNYWQKIFREFFLWFFQMLKTGKSLGFFRLFVFQTARIHRDETFDTNGRPLHGGSLRNLARTTTRWRTYQVTPFGILIEKWVI
jgi:hypothetical protein